MSDNTEKKPIDFSEFIAKYYEMRPDVEDVLGDGYNLEDGMKVVIEDPELRMDIETLRFFTTHVSAESNGALSTARLLNRWCVVSEIQVWDDSHVTFVGIYDDGVKRQRKAPIEKAWIVKKDSIRTEQEDYEESRNKYWTAVKDVMRPPTIKIPEYLVDPDPHADGSSRLKGKMGLWEQWASSVGFKHEPDPNPTKIDGKSYDQLVDEMVGKERTKQKKFEQERAEFRSRRNVPLTDQERKAMRDALDNPLSDEEIAELSRENDEGLPSEDWLERPNGKEE